MELGVPEPPILEHVPREGVQRGHNVQDEPHYLRRARFAKRVNEAVVGKREENKLRPGSVSSIL